MKDNFIDLKNIFTNHSDEEFYSLFQEELLSAREKASSESYALPKKGKSGRKKDYKLQRKNAINHAETKKRSLSTSISQENQQTLTQKYDQIIQLNSRKKQRQS